MSEQLIKNILIVILLAIAVASDLRTRKIPNKMVLAFFALSALVSLTVSGPSSLWTALAATLTAFVFALPMYLLRAIGGGDLKLIVAISPLMSWEAVIIMVLASLLWGSILGFFSALTHGQLKQLGQNLVGILMRVGPNRESLHKIPYSVAIFFGWVTQVTLTYYGMRPL